MTQPVHLTEWAKGLDLRGEERNLIAMKASMEGAKSVYREGMAFLQNISGTSEGKTIAKLPMKISGYPTAYPLIWISMIVLMNMYLGSKY